MDLDDLYRRVIMDHYQHPRNWGEMDQGEEAIIIELNNPTCGDRIHLHLKVTDQVIERALFSGEGCSISLASASMMTEAVKGLEVDKALELVNLFSLMMRGEQVDIAQFPLEDIEALSGVTKFPARIKCAMLAWKALEKRGS